MFTLVHCPPITRSYPRFKPPSTAVTAPLDRTLTSLRLGIPRNDPLIAANAIRLIRALSIVQTQRIAELRALQALSVVGKIILLALDAVDGKRVRGEHLAVVAELADAALAGFGTDFKDIRHAARAGIAARVADAVDRDADFLAVARKGRAPRPGEGKVGAFALRREEARGVGGRGEGEDLDEGGGAHDGCFQFLSLMWLGGFAGFCSCECCEWR